MVWVSIFRVVPTFRASFIQLENLINCRGVTNSLQYLSGSLLQNYGIVSRFTSYNSFWWQKAQEKFSVSPKLYSCTVETIKLSGSFSLSFLFIFPPFFFFFLRIYSNQSSCLWWHSPMQQHIFFAQRRVRDRLWQNHIRMWEQAYRSASSSSTASRLWQEDGSPSICILGHSD